LRREAERREGFRPRPDGLFWKALLLALTPLAWLVERPLPPRIKYFLFYAFFIPPLLGISALLGFFSGRHELGMTWSELALRIGAAGLVLAVLLGLLLKVGPHRLDGLP
jgi:hypothetical protein